MRLNRRLGSDLPPLVLMTDDERLPDVAAAAAQLPRGSLVIVRAREPMQRGVTTRLLMPIARRRKLKLIIANDPEFAQRIGAHGIHLSEACAREAPHWRALRPHWIITVAAHSLAACATAKLCGADAALLSPVLPTQSHRGASDLGIVRALLMARQSPLPVYALGGIDSASASRLRESQFAGLAAIGALGV